MQSLKLIFFLIIFQSLYAQIDEMQIVGKPQKSDTEFVSLRDANGRFCAAIQVISNRDGFSYDAYNGVVKVDDQPGKDMVYLQASERVVEIFLTGYKPLKIILSEIGIQLREKEVWKIEIKGAARTSDLLLVTILVQPDDAYVTVNDNRVMSGQPVKLSKGSHRLRISKEGYQTREENINVSESQVLFNFSLSEVQLEAVVIKSVPGEAQVFLDGADKGTTGQDGKPLFLFPGTYQLQVKKSGYVEASQTLTVVVRGNNTFTFNLEKNSGTLELAIQPADATVLVNRENYSGRTRIELPPGQYKIEVTKSGYHSQSETVSLARGETLRKSYTLNAITGRLQFTVQPLSARVSLKRGGRTVENWTGMKLLNELQVGEYELEVSADGYENQIKRIQIDEKVFANHEIILKKADTPTASLRDNKVPNQRDITKSITIYADPFQDLVDLAYDIIEAGGIAAVGQATSQRQDEGKRRAVKDAQGQLAEIFNARVERMKKMFQEEIGSNKDSEINEAFTTVTKVLTRTMLQGAVTKQTKYMRDPKTKQFTVGSVVAIEPDKVILSILDEVKKSKPNLYERFRASQAYEELDKAMEKYEQENKDKFN